MNEPKQNGDTRKSNYHQSQHVLEISKTKTTDIIRNSINTNKEKISPEKKIPKVLNKKQEHDQEKEIMRKTKENINRKSKPIMKYVDDNNDTLKIGKTDNVNNWEDLFDDEGQLQDELFTEVIIDIIIFLAVQLHDAFYIICKTLLLGFLLIRIIFAGR